MLLGYISYMKHLAIALSLFFIGGCSMSKAYPAIATTGGAAIGSIGGPGGAAGGALIGYGIGKGAQLATENQDLIEKVDALTQGDVEGLIGEESARVWAYVKFFLWAVILWNLIPICYTIFVHRKQKEVINGKAKESS